MKTLHLFLLATLPLQIMCVCHLPLPDPHHLCRDENGTPVEWWVVYKPPGRDHYVYRTSASPNQNGNQLLNIRAPHDSHMGCTVISLISALPNDVPEYYSFNDNGDSEDTPVPIPTYGLGKGLLVRGEASAFWITHSIVGQQFKHGVSFSVPASATQHGHSAACISLPYKKQLTDAFRSRLCHLNPGPGNTNVVNPCPASSLPQGLYLDFVEATTGNTHVFLSNAYTSTPTHQKDIYQRLSEVFGSSPSSPLLVQSGRSLNRLPPSGGVVNSNCIHYRLGGQNQTAKQNLDLAKIAWFPQKNVYAFGDGARTSAHGIRGGGAMSFVLPGPPFVELSPNNCP